MWCHITQPNSVVLEVELDPKCRAQELMDKVCSQLGIIEQDYFGLQYVGSKSELLWLNLRNRITRQVSGNPPYRFCLRVKFFVQPHFLLQEATRHLFYLQVRSEFAAGSLKIEDPESMMKIAALIAQAELGDFNEGGSHVATYMTFLPPLCQNSPEFKSRVAIMHSQLCGLRPETAWYRMLQIVAEQPSFGVEYHKVQFPIGESVISGQIGVGPEGITLYNRNWITALSIAYPAVKTIQHKNNRNLYLDSIQDNGSPLQLTLKLVSDKAASGLYRAITEMHSFYRCDTIRNAVSSQFSRDIKGTLASLFNENTTLGTHYVFDIQRTCREAYDHFRRKLYTPTSTSHLESLPVRSQENHNSDSCHGCSQGSCQEMKARLEHMQEDLLCRVCMDNSINTTFCPCGHLVCCQSCANRLSVCPICRCDIQNTQHIFLPSSLQALKS